MCAKTITANDLAQFSGSEELYRHWTRRLTYTPGALFLADNAGAHWLIDLIASHQLDRRLRSEPFQLWTLTVRPDKTARAEAFRDSGEPALLWQDIEYTDFPADLAATLKLYVVDGVLMLPSEY